MEVTLNKGVATKRGLLENTILSWVKKKQSILPHLINLCISEHFWEVITN